MTAEDYTETHEYSTRLSSFATIEYCDSYCGYEWDQFHVLRGIDGYLYVGADSGCSCNSFGDFDPEDLERVPSWVAAAEKAREWAAERPADEWDYGREAAAMQLIERLAEKRPAAHIQIDARRPWKGGK